jgi:hypothetical protein
MALARRRSRPRRDPPVPHRRRHRTGVVTSPTPGTARRPASSASRPRRRPASRAAQVAGRVTSSPKKGQAMTPQIPAGTRPCPGAAPASSSRPDAACRSGPGPARRRPQQPVRRPSPERHRRHARQSPGVSRSHGDRGASSGVVVGSSARMALPGGRDRPAELLQPVPVMERRPRCRRYQRLWRGGPGRRGPDCAASWCAGRSRPCLRESLSGVAAAVPVVADPMLGLPAPDEPAPYPGSPVTNDPGCGGWAVASCILTAAGQPPGGWPGMFWPGVTGPGRCRSGCPRNR